MKTIRQYKVAYCVYNQRQSVNFKGDVLRGLTVSEAVI